MKGFILALVIVAISGCCTNDICNTDASYTPGLDTAKPSNCSVCSHCGYERTYKDSGWY